MDKYANYRKLSIQKFTIPFMHQLEQMIEYRISVIAEKVEAGDEQAVELNADLLQGNLDGVERLKNRIASGEFVDDGICTDGVWVDMKSYYEDLIKENKEKIAGMSGLLEAHPNKQLEGKVSNLQRINAAMQRKIDTNRLDVPDTKIDTNPDTKRSEQAKSKRQQLKNKAGQLAEKIRILENARD